MKQIAMLKSQPMAYGGELLKTRKGRSMARPLDTRHTMHLVLRSTKAKGHWSFRRLQNHVKIQKIVDKFSVKYGVKVLTMANVGNHLHFQIKLGNRFAYKPFIRAITSAIAMAVTGASRWSPLKDRLKKVADTGQAETVHFWDYRPFTRVVRSLRAMLTLRDYIKINRLEGYGVNREHARLIVSAGPLSKFGDSS
jgi:hypothetical protein